MKYEVVRYMTKWAIRERIFFFWKTLLRHGDHWDVLPVLDGKVITFDTKEEAETWINEIITNRVNV